MNITFNNLFMERVPGYEGETSPPKEVYPSLPVESPRKDPLLLLKCLPSPAKKKDCVAYSSSKHQGRMPTCGLTRREVLSYGQRFAQFLVLFGCLLFLIYHTREIEKKEASIRNDIKHMTKIRQMNVEKMSKLVSSIDRANQSPADRRAAEACAKVVCMIPCAKGKASKFSKFLVSTVDAIRPMLEMLPGVAKVASEVLQSIKTFTDVITDQPYTTQSTHHCGVALSWNEATNAGQDPLLMLSYNPEAPWAMNDQPKPSPRESKRINHLKGKAQHPSQNHLSNEIFKWGGGNIIGFKHEDNKVPRGRVKRASSALDENGPSSEEDEKLALLLSQYWNITLTEQTNGHDMLVKLIEDIFEQHA